MADDGERPSRLNVSNEAWTLRKAALPRTAASDLTLRRPFTGGGPLRSRLMPAIGGVTKRPASAGAEKSRSLVFSESTAHASGFRLGNSSQLRPFRSASADVSRVREDGSLRRSSDILAAPSVANDVPREFPGYPETRNGDEQQTEEESVKSRDDCDQDICSDDDEVENTIESLREHLRALQSFPDHLQGRFKNLDDVLKQKENELVELSKRNRELDADIEEATVKIDDYVKQERDIREEYDVLDDQYLSLDREKSELARELDLAKKDRDDLEIELNEKVESFQLHVKDCEAAAAKKEELLRDQGTEAVMKGEKIKELSEELSYVQRKIESFVDQIRAGEELKAQQSSELRKAEESRDNLQAKLSKASEERRFFRMELDGERETAKSSLADLKSKLETVVRDLFDHSLSQLQGVRNDLLQNKEENQMLSTQVRLLQRDASTVEGALNVILECGTPALDYCDHSQDKLSFHKEDLKVAVRNLRSLSPKFDSVTIKGGNLALAIRHLSTLLADSTSKNIAYSSRISLLQAENTRLKRNHHVTIAETHKSMQKHASVFKFSFEQTLNEFELVHSSTVEVIAAAVLQLEDHYRERANALAPMYAESLSNFSDQLYNFQDEAKETRERFCAEISQDIFRLKGKLVGMKRCLQDEKREHRGCQRRGHELEDALLAKSKDLARLENSVSLAATRALELETHTTFLTSALENANLKLKQSESLQAELLEVKNQREGAQKLLLTKARECALLLARSEGAEQALLLSRDASNALKTSAEESQSRAQLAEVALSRMQDRVDTLEMNAEKNEIRATEAEAAQIRLQDAAANFEERAKNSEMQAKANGEEVSKNLRLENESLAEDLRRAKSLAAETERNLGESAALTLKAVSDKQAIEATLASCRELHMNEKQEVNRMKAELEFVTKNAAVNRNALMSDIEAGQVAVADGQSEILRLTADRKSILGEVEEDKEKLSHALSIARDALEQERKEHSKLVLEYDTLAERAAVAEAAVFAERKDKSDEQFKAIVHQQGPDNSDGDLSPFGDTLHERGSQAPEPLSTSRKSMRKKTRTPHEHRDVPSVVKGDSSEDRDGPKSDMKLKLQQKMAKRREFKRPRAIADDKKSRPRGKSEGTAVYRSKRIKKGLEGGSKAARLGSDDDDDWMVG